MSQGRQLALVVGIDHYLPHRLPDGSSYHPLLGAVRDARRMAEFLRERGGVAADDLRVLTSSAGGGGDVAEPAAERPSYENLAGSWRELLARAEAGDQLLVHYSGHGGRTPTAFPELRPPGSLDECLVPFDIGTPQGRYLRDAEIAFLLAEAARRGVFTVLLLDCCHSGGATRTGARPRGIAAIDTRPRPLASLVADPASLAAVVARREGPAVRGFGPVRAFSNDPHGYVMLAACRANEWAFEAVFAGRQPQGALTHWLLDSLETARPGLTYRELHARLVGRIHQRFPAQTPQYEGEADRMVLSLDGGAAERAIFVLQGCSEPARKRAPAEVLLGAGQVHGLRVGARLAVAALAAGGSTELIAEVTRLGASQSLAQVTDQPPEAVIPDGARARLVEPGPTALRRPVAFLPATAAHPALERLAEAIRRRPNAFLELANGEPSPSPLWVGLDAGGRYQLCDAAGEPLPNLPPLPTTRPRAEEVVVDQLLHLAKYLTVWELENYDPGAALRGALDVEVLRLPHGFQRGERPRPVPFAFAGVPDAKVGEWICLRVENRAERALNLAVLDLQPNWACEQIHPPRSRSAAELLEPEGEVLIPLCAGLPPGLAAGTDVLKVFVTVGPVSYDALELPPIEAARRSHSPAAPPRNPLERLFATLAATSPVTRSLRQPPDAADEWWVEERAVRVVG